ncbi:brachyurin [Dendroctonus ponderosae]
MLWIRAVIFVGISLLVETTPLKSYRIVGGVEACPHSLPYQVALILDRLNFCGGVLVSTTHVLTAAHCVSQNPTIEVVLGAHNLGQYEETQIVIYDPIIIVHENFSASELKNDIALLKLKHHIQLSAAVMPVALVGEDDDLSGCSGVLSGWGLTSYADNHMQNKLRKVSVEVLTDRMCISYLNSNGLSDPKSYVCTGGFDTVFGAVGACFGDSGGPLVVKNSLIGLVSFGDETCEYGQPTVFTSISYYRNWINKFSGI